MIYEDRPLFGLNVFGRIVDFTRWQRKPRTFDGVEDALEETAGRVNFLWRPAQ
jgi:hypothetical protein